MDRNELDTATVSAWLNWWNRINNVLDVEERKPVATLVTEGRLEIKGALSTVHIRGGPLPVEVAKLVEARTQARAAKDFRTSDELRDKIAALGWEVRDTKDGQKLTRRREAQSG